MPDRVAIERQLDEDWRMVCPKHHHRLQRQAGPTVYCEGCGHAYRYEDLIDKRQTENQAIVPPTTE